MLSRAAVEDDDDLEFAGIILSEKLRVIAQHRFDAALLVVSRNQDEQAGVGHTLSFKFQVSSFKFGLAALGKARLEAFGGISPEPPEGGTPNKDSQDAPIWRMART